MDLIILDKAYNAAKILTYSFLITSAACTYLYLKVLSKVPLTVEQLIKNSSSFLGKQVKVIGTAVGHSLKVTIKKSFNLPKQVVLSINTTVIDNWRRNKSVQTKLNSFIVKGTEDSLRVLVNDRTKVVAPVVYFSSIRPFSGFSQIFQSFCQSFLGLFRREIDLSFRTRVTKTENAIFEGSRVVVSGVLSRNKDGLHLVSSSLAAGVDVELASRWNQLNLSLQLLASSVLVMLMIGIFYRCRTGQLKIFSKEKKKKDVGEARIDECIICLVNKRNILIKPCHHIVVCSTCIDMNFCPICRVNIENFVEIEFFKG